MEIGWACSLKTHDFHETFLNPRVFFLSVLKCFSRVQRTKLHFNFGNPVDELMILLGHAGTHCGPPLNLKSLARLGVLLSRMFCGKSFHFQNTRLAHLEVFIVCSVDSMFACRCIPAACSALFTKLKCFHVDVVCASAIARFGSSDVDVF